MGLPDYGILTILSFLVVVTIVSDHRLGIERRLRSSYGIDRDWWVPLLALGSAYVLGVIGWSSIEAAIIEKSDVLSVVLTIGLLAEGLRESGLFRYISYKVVAAGQGDFHRLVVLVFLSTSVLTLFTTNDVVVLILTPVLLDVCYRAEIRNAKLLLLSQFVAANTLSMGFLIGSPTNLIVSDELNLGFLSYLELMFGPAAVAACTSLLVIVFVLAVSRKTDRFVGGLVSEENYVVPTRNPESEFTSQMRDWMGLFVVFVAVLSVGTYYGGVLWPASVFGVGAFIIYRHMFVPDPAPARGVVKRLPLGIVFFGLVFFAFSDAIVGTGVIQTHVVPMLQARLNSYPVSGSVVSMIAVGALVNVFNDLPAAALIAELLNHLSFSGFTRVLFVQAVVAALNVGAYVSPVGALAGLIWFNQLRVHSDKVAETDGNRLTDMQIPTRSDLVCYGILHFASVCVAMGGFLFLEWLLATV